MGTYVVNVNEIDKKYVGDNCVQIMPSFSKSLSIFWEKGLAFYGRFYHENKVDNSVYIADERKNQFPYNNIPWHWTRRYLMKKILYVNQIFDYNKPYILLRDGYIFQYNVVKHNDKSYIISSVFKFEKEDKIKKEYVKKNEIYKYFQNLINVDDDNLTYVLDSTGKHLNICYDDNERRTKKYELIEFLKQKKLYYDVQNNDIWYSNGDFIVEDNFILPVDKNLFVIKVVGNKIKTSGVYINSLDDNMVSVTSVDIPIKIFNEQEINKLIQQSKSKLREPIFSKKYTLVNKKNK